MNPQLSIPQADLRAFCRAHAVRELAIFGSAVRGDFGPDSDVDVLIDLAPEARIGLIALQRMSMNTRRHTTVILFGFNMATFNPMQAYQQGVHAVVNPSEMFLLLQLIQKAGADNDMFLHTFREVQRRVA